MSQVAAHDGSCVKPAQLSFLAIYNPSLGKTDDTLQEQIVFYSSKEDRIRRRSVKRRDGDAEDELDIREEGEENERLRQVGLAQGMVDFVK